MLNMKYFCFNIFKEINEKVIYLLILYIFMLGTYIILIAQTVCNSSYC